MVNPRREKGISDTNDPCCTKIPISGRTAAAGEGLGVELTMMLMLNGCCVVGASLLATLELLLVCCGFTP